MIDNANYGAHGYAIYEEDELSYGNEYHSNSMRMMPPPQYSNAHHASFSTGSHGSYADAWHGNGFQNGHYSQSTSPNGFTTTNAFNVRTYGGKVPGMHYPSGLSQGRVQSNNMMMNSEYETYRAGPGGRMKIQNFGMHSDGYDDFATGMHGSHQKVEYKNL